MGIVSRALRAERPGGHNRTSRTAEIESDRFNIRPSVVKTLLLQRTEYQRPEFADRIPEAFFADMKAEFVELAPHLPEQASTILDIGGGLGAIDLFLLERYASWQPHLHLLDKNEISPDIEYFFRDTPAAYNLFDETNHFLTDNGVAPAQITQIDAAADGFPVVLRPDLVVSLLAWGYHFPLSVYLPAVLDCLRPGGCLVIDVRKGTNGVGDIMTAFANVILVRETFRQIRLVAYR